MSNNRLRHNWINLCVHNRDGSHATQYARRAVLKLAARQLERELGFRNMCASSLGQRHLVALVKHWQGEGLGVGTIKNRMAHLRWAAEKVGKPGVAGISNSELGLEKRVYVAKVSRAIDLPSRTLELITDPHVRISLRLQEAFGLRREESLKIIPARAWQGGQLVLQASCTKGGRPRAGGANRSATPLAAAGGSFGRSRLADPATAQLYRTSENLRATAIGGWHFTGSWIAPWLRAAPLRGADPVALPRWLSASSLMGCAQALSAKKMLFRDELRTPKLA